MPRTILDVSKWQGRIDWDKVKASGLVSGVMIRAMGNSKEGKPSKPYIDPYFARNYAECTRLGIPCGVYGYFKATTKAQADERKASKRACWPSCTTGCIRVASTSWRRARLMPAA